MRWTAADLMLLLLWFHQGMKQQHPPPAAVAAVGEAVDGGGEQQDDVGLLHPPHPKDDSLPQYLKKKFGFLGFFETGLFIQMYRNSYTY
jgi:hypothetical protein